MSSEKLEILYKYYPSEFIVVGRQAVVFVVDSDGLGGKEFFTEPVIDYCPETGAFETEFAVYKPWERK